MAPAAQAQDAGLHHAQTNSLLGFASSEVKVLAAALGARQFDLELTQSITKELKRTITDAKKSVDRTSALLDEKQEKLQPKFEALRAILVTAEKQVTKLEKDLDGSVTPYIEQFLDEGSDDLELAKTEKVAEPDWDAIKAHAGWLNIDIGAARKAHGKLSSGAKMPRLRTPPKPKGKRQ